MELTQRINRKFGLKLDNLDRAKNDLYPTPHWVTQALIDHERFDGTICEPARGNLNIVKVFNNNSLSMMYSDISEEHGNNDFLESTDRYDHIITNPPFPLATEFIEKAVELASYKVALLLPVPYLASIKRKELFKRTNLTRVHIICKRLKVGTPKGPITSHFNHAWFIGDKTKFLHKSTTINWI